MKNKKLNFVDYIYIVLLLSLVIITTINVVDRRLIYNEERIHLQRLMPKDK